MALVKTLNYFSDGSSRLRRIPWDTWYQDGEKLGLSPAPTGPTLGIEFSSAGVVSLKDDFMDEGQGEDITTLQEWDDENTFLDTYDDVCYSYESDCCQTYETEYHTDSRSE